MKLQVLSDLHIDIEGGFTPRLARDAGLVVVAGDVCEGPAEGMAFLRQHIPPPTPIVMIAGNHEYYRRGMKEEREAAAAHARRHGIVFLDDHAAVIDGVRFVGATLWTDFALDGLASQPHAMLAARDRLNDFKRISLAVSPAEPFTPQAATDLHRTSRAFLARALAEPHSGPTVVVTHHAPHANSVVARFKAKATNAAYASNLEDLIAAGQPDLWIHGHIHSSVDYRLGSTRVVSNPRGYGDENPDFRPTFTIDLR